MWNTVVFVERAGETELEDSGSWSNFDSDQSSPASFDEKRHRDS
jgi:hypothetical protein